MKIGKISYKKVQTPQCSNSLTVDNYRVLKPILLTTFLMEISYFSLAIWNDLKDMMFVEFSKNFNLIDADCNFRL